MKRLSSFDAILLLGMLSSHLHAQPSFRYLGFNYTAFQQGLLPYTNSWQAQDFTNSQAIQSVSLTDAFACEGNGALALEVKLIGGDPNFANGETFVDMRNYPPIENGEICEIPPLNLAGQRITLKVFCPPGLAGDANASNGFQLFVKDEQWRSFYGSWTNIQPLGGTCHLISLTPSTTAPPGGFMDIGFDPTQIRSIGLKIGANGNWNGSFEGTIWLDDIRWGSEPAPKYGFEQAINSLSQMSELPVNTVSLVITWFMDSLNSTTVYQDPQRSPDMDGIRATIDSLHARGFSLMLKPHVDVQDGSWRGFIQPLNTAAWFESYRNFMQQLAQIANDKEVGIFCVGTELSRLEHLRPQWAKVIEEIRATAPKVRLTYAANWDAFLLTSFWDLLDMAGVDAYFPFGNVTDPSVETITTRWQLWKELLVEWQDSIQKPVLFTEIGYASHEAAAIFPWIGCPNINASTCSYAHHCELQGRLYEAAMRSFCRESWFEGMLFWNWEPVTDTGGCCNRDFTPQNKASTLETFFKPLAFVDTLELSCEDEQAILYPLLNDCGQALEIVSISGLGGATIVSIEQEAIMLQQFGDSLGTFYYTIKNQYNRTDEAKVIVKYTSPDTDGDGIADCVDTDNDSLSTGLEDILAFKLHLYPNPADEQLVLEFPDGTSQTEAYSLRMSNLYGQEVYTQPLGLSKNKTIISLKTLTKGVYILSVLDKNQRLIGYWKFVRY